MRGANQESRRNGAKAREARREKKESEEREERVGEGVDRENGGKE